VDDPAGSSLVESLDSRGCFIGPIAGLGGVDGVLDTGP
jgi:hypothetical protein